MREFHIFITFLLTNYAKINYNNAKIQGLKMCKHCGCSINLKDKARNEGHLNVNADHTHSKGDQISYPLNSQNEDAHTHSHEDSHSHTHATSQAQEDTRWHEDSLHSHSHSYKELFEHAHPTLKEDKTIEVIGKILSKNDTQARHNKEHFDENKVLCLNLMSSPGSGKTTLLEATIKALKEKFNICVIEGDLETENDAKRVREAGAKAYQITTGQSCHLDAFMVHNALHHLDLNGTDLLFIENVGNLVCPASYDLGEHLNVVLLSVTEGDDKPAKYPVMFRKADLVVISKADLAPHFDFNTDKAIKECKKLNPKVDVIVLDAKNGTNLDLWLRFLNLKKELC